MPNDKFNLRDLGSYSPEALRDIPLPRALRRQILAASRTDRDPYAAQRSLRMPVLAAATQRVTGRPFENLRVLLVLHCLYDLLYFTLFAEDLGLDPARTLVLYKPYPYQSGEHVRRCLQAWGYRLAPVEDRAAVVPLFLREGDENILVIEDGGYIVPLIHEVCPEFLPLVLGAVEQTSRGERLDRGVQNLRIPVLSVAHSQIKADFEPDAVAEAVWANITKQLAPDVIWSGRSVVIVGYGPIGQALARVVRERNTVTVVERDPYRLALARLRGCLTQETIVAALQRHEVKLIIGATGGESISNEAIGALPDGVFLASASSDQVEIGVERLRELAEQVEEVGEGCMAYHLPGRRRVHLLAEGYPVNFYASESVQDQLIDTVMTQMFICAISIAVGGQHAAGVDDESVEQLSNDFELAGAFYEHHWQTGPALGLPAASDEDGGAKDNV